MASLCVLPFLGLEMYVYCLASRFVAFTPLVLTVLSLFFEVKSPAFGP